MKHTITLAIITLLLLAACSQSPTGNVTADKIKIGVIAPLTGDSAVFGENTKDGALFAYEHLPPELKDKYELIIEDDQMDNAKTVAAYQKLKNVNGVKAIIGISSGSGNSMAQLAEDDKTLFCSIASDPEIVKNRKYVFKHWTTPEEEAHRYVKELKKLGWTKIVSFETNHQGAKAIVDALDAAAKPEGINIERHVFNQEDKDARTVLTKLKGKDFDTIGIFLLPQHSVEISQQVREMGFEHPLTSIEVVEFIEGEDLDLFEDQWYVTAADPIGSFISDYSNAKGEKPGFALPNAYDCLNILVKAYEESDGDQEGAINIIHSLKDYNGAMGTLHYNQGSIESPAVKKIVQNREFVTAD